MDVALALDVSTSVIGWAVLPVGSPIGTYPLLRGHIDLRRVKGGFWDKVDEMERMLTDVITSVATQYVIKQLFIEDFLLKFRKGASSIQTIALLARFNSVVSSHARRTTRLDPLYIGATDARRAIGVPLLSKKRANGVDQKQQTFDYLCKTVFLNESWPRNRNGNIQPWCGDEVDAVVICQAGCLGLGNPA